MLFQRKVTYTSQKALITFYDDSAFYFSRLRAMRYSEHDMKGFRFLYIPPGNVFNDELQIVGVIVIYLLICVYGID